MINMNQYFTFDGMSSLTFDAVVFPGNDRTMPGRQYIATEVPGRNGDLLTGGNRYSNVEHSYEVIIYRNFESNFSRLINFLLSRNGYCRLEDSFKPDEFYMAYYTGPTEPRVARNGEIGRFTVTFNRQPQRWLKSGEVELTATMSNVTGTGFVVTNPTAYSAYPLFKVTGTNKGGGFTFRFFPGTEETSGGASIQMIDVTSVYDDYRVTQLANYPLYIDIETLQSYITYNGGTYYNKAVGYEMRGGGEVANRFLPGENRIRAYSSDTTNIDGISIIPRWYQL